MLATAALVPLLVTASACSSGGQTADPVDATTSTGPIGAANVPLDTTIDVPGSRAALEAGHGEIRRVLEAELGSEGWRETRPAQETACPSRVDDSGKLDDGIGKFYAPEMSHPETLSDDDNDDDNADASTTDNAGNTDSATWAEVWDEIVRAVEPHGFRPKSGDIGESAGASAAGAAASGTAASGTAASGAAQPAAAARYLYLINSHQDELTVSTHPTIGTGYGGFGVCHPWGD